MFFLPARERLRARRRGPHAKPGRFRQGPGKIRLAHRGPGEALTLASRGLRTLDEAAGCHAIVPTWEAAAVLACLAQPQTQALADAWARPPQGERSGGVWLGRLEDRQGHLTAQAILGVKQREVDC